jgi:predicted ribosome quality control (RQC) complex YloA/Tae2 family protein
MTRTGPEFGLIAEEVAEVHPDLVVRDENGEIYTVRYDAVNAMLLNEFLKEHKQGEQQDRKIEELEATVGRLEPLLKEQAMQIQKVSAQLELKKPASRTVAIKP